jgi:hypothetical protein
LAWIPLVPRGEYGPVGREEYLQESVNIVLEMKGIAGIWLRLRFTHAASVLCLEPVMNPDVLCVADPEQPVRSFSLYEASEHGEDKGKTNHLTSYSNS